MRALARLAAVGIAGLSMVVAAGGAPAQARAERHLTKHPTLAASLLDEAGVIGRRPRADASPHPWSDARGRFKVVIDGDVDAIRAALASVGGRIDSEVRGSVQAYVSPADLIKLADAPGVRSVREPRLARPQVESEGVAETGMAPWHGEGFTGDGVTLAVVDIGFMGREALRGAGELPEAFETQNHCDNDLDGDHPGRPA